MFGLEQLAATVKDLPSPDGKWEMVEIIGTWLGQQSRVRGWVTAPRAMNGLR